MRPVLVTLSYLFHPTGRILLGSKKDGTMKYGSVRYTGLRAILNGFGGKVLETDPTIASSAIRETLEETGVRMIHPILRALVIFHNPGLDVACYVFFASAWEGTPRETEEMTVRWYQMPPPYEQMLPGDRYWLPVVLASGKARIDVEYAESLRRPRRIIISTDHAITGEPRIDLADLERTGERNP